MIILNPFNLRISHRLSLTSKYPNQGDRSTLEMNRGKGNLHHNASWRYDSKEPIDRGFGS